MRRGIVNRLKRFKAQLESVRTNRFGRTLPERVLIIESDDWGAIRTPSDEVLTAFSKKGIDNTANVYRNDSLASGEDLDLLFELLGSFKDNTGRPLKMTANVIVANPDFAAIERVDFRQYHYELFTDTFKRYPRHQNNWQKWQMGEDQGVFQPQSHGREHLQIKRWLRALQEDHGLVRYCFQYGSTHSGCGDYSFMEAFDWDEPNDLEEQKDIVLDALALFKAKFGYSSRSFIAPCYNWDAELEQTLHEQGVAIMQSLRQQLVPTGTFGEYLPIYHAAGQQSASGLLFNIRNCFLEPSLLPCKDWVDSCLAQIQMAFRMKKPAVICSHRINYVGFISEANRDRGLRDLQKLIKTVLKRWPDVQFISTDELERYWQ